MLSIWENALRKYLKLLYPYNNFYYNIRPDWLKWSSWRNLELDIYCPEKNEAWEFQGVQHYRDGDQIDRDKEKKSICRKLKVKFHQVNLKQLHIMIERKKTKPLFIDLFKNIDSYIKIAKKEYKDISAKKKKPALRPLKKKTLKIKK